MGQGGLGGLLGWLPKPRYCSQLHLDDGSGRLIPTFRRIFFHAAWRKRNDAVAVGGTLRTRFPLRASHQPVRRPGSTFQSPHLASETIVQLHGYGESGAIAEMSVNTGLFFAGMTSLRDTAYAAWPSSRYSTARVARWSDLTSRRCWIPARQISCRL